MRRSLRTRLAHSESMRASQHRGVFASAGLIVVDGPFSRGGAFDRGGAENGIDFLILDGLALPSRDFGGPLLLFGLRGLPRVEDKFLEIPSVY